MDIEKLKNDIALKHGYQDGILGSPWEYAMRLTYRTKRQIALYEEVIEALANSSHENSGLHKHVVSGLLPGEDWINNQIDILSKNCEHNNYTKREIELGQKAFMQGYVWLLRSLLEALGNER